MTEDNKPIEQAPAQELAPIAEVDQTLNSSLVQESELDLDEAEPAIVEKPTTVKKVQSGFQTTQVSDTTVWDDTQEVVPLPSANMASSMHSVNDTENISLMDNAKSREWAGAYTNGLDHLSYQDAYEETLGRSGAKFTQGIKTEEGLLAGAYPRLKQAENQTLVGERATMRLLSFLGMGNTFSIPLWHTGIWITLRAPSEGDLLELNRQITADKIKFGRKSYGLVLSNEMSYMADRLINFVIAHMYETSLEEAIDLKTIISSHDIPTLLWGLAGAIYPRGVQYTRACITDPAKCNHIVKDRLNLSKLQWSEESGLTTSQILHMTKRRRNSMKLDSVKSYQEQMLSNQKRTIVLNEGSSVEFKVTLKVPSIAEYVDSGHRWISNIVSMVNKGMGVEADNNLRDNYILQQGQSTVLRLYTHWVESIEFGSNFIDDKETLENNFNALSSDDKIRNEFMTKVAKYINDSCMCVIGIPAYECPSCGSAQENQELPKFINVIPIDTYEVFFTLLGQKLERLTVR